MAESKPDPKMSDRALGTGMHHDHQHHRETHGLRDDIDENTPMSEVKAPSVFERAKEEIEALVEAIHPKKEPKHVESTEKMEAGGKGYMQSEKLESHSEKHVKKPNLIESLMHKPHRHKETHGTSDDIDENTPISEVKGPNVFERAKEEIEALISTIHPKKDTAVSSQKKEGGLPSIGRGLEKICSPRSHHNKDDD